MSLICTRLLQVGKMKHLPREHGDGAMRAMASIKQALDPANIMNPGKIVDLSVYGS